MQHSELLEFAVGIAHEAGIIMRQYFNQADQGVSIKQDASPVTEADKAVNSLLIERVTASFPEHGVLGEEESHHEDRRELWVCDPIDGTQGFILGIPTAMFSLAFVVDGAVQVAVAYDPFQDKLYSAIKEQGAKVNNTLLRVSGRESLAGSSLTSAGSFASLSERLDAFEPLLAQGAKLQPIVPGNVFKGTLVASGKVEGYIFPGRSSHDIAALKLIVEEAGGKVTDLYGNEQRYDGKIQGALISNGHLHQALVDAIVNHGVEQFLGY